MPSMDGLMDAAVDNTHVSDLPDVVLEAIFGFCATKETVQSICLVCRRWLSVYQHSSITLPMVSLTAPLHESWMQQHGQKLVKVRGG